MPRNSAEVADQSIWFPTSCHVNLKQAGYVTNAQRALKSAGLEKYFDIVQQDGLMVPWEVWVEKGAVRHHTRAYKKLYNNIQPPEL